MYTYSVPHGNRAPRKLPGGAAGPITRLVSPGDLGEILKLLVFLDLFQRRHTHGQRRFGMHPHSGIATLTLLIEGDTAFVLGSAVKHPHDLVLGHYSVHTSQAALAEGEAEIRRIGL